MPVRGMAEVPAVVLAAAPAAPEAIRRLAAARPLAAPRGVPAGLPANRVAMVARAARGAPKPAGQGALA
jgi:hypothetical protein